jgi:hypothetical protein
VINERFELVNNLSRLLLRRLGRSGSTVRRSGSGISRRRGSIGRRRSVCSRSSRSFCGRRFSSRSSSFLLRAGRQHQRSNKSAKNEFGVHRSIPREARVVRKRSGSNKEQTGLRSGFFLKIT